MDWFRLLLLSFATFTAWEWLRDVLPLPLPAAIQPPVVVALAFGAQRLPDPWLLAVSAAGGVAVLHALVRGGASEAASLRLPRRHPATGRRVPDLP